MSRDRKGGEDTKLMGQLEDQQHDTFKPSTKTLNMNSLNI